MRGNHFNFASSMINDNFYDLTTSFTSKYSEVNGHVVVSETKNGNGNGKSVIMKKGHTVAC